MKDSSYYRPSEQLLKAVRANLVLRGLSFAAYCRKEGLTRQNARSALVGNWTGPKAQETVRQIVDNLGIEP